MANMVLNTIIFPTRGEYDSFVYGHDKSAGFSFNWVIPQPKTPTDCNILAWNRDNWGVKWDASDCGVGFFDDEACRIDFETPWDPPFPVYERMAQQGFCFSFTWTAEIDGGFSGKGHTEDKNVVIDEQHFESADNEL